MVPGEGAQENKLPLLNCACAFFNALSWTCSWRRRGAQHFVACSLPPANTLSENVERQSLIRYQNEAFALPTYSNQSMRSDSKVCETDSSLLQHHDCMQAQNLPLVAQTKQRLSIGLAEKEGMA